MTYNEWVIQASCSYDPYRPGNHYRIGQHYFNMLAKERPDILARIPLSGSMARTLDPFYNDNNLNRFLQFVHDVW